ncbi:DUF7507 domain-containing protein [Prescottella subtropica]|uniref:DUF7507 domain-containing protein n=1 Tax=Prescottella subtropica TaxID=2545757 RepID=UPI0010F5D954|nr:DUF11 domain-containing protein [Prescottella subtropica]
MRKCGAAFRIPAVAALTGLVTLTTSAFGPVGVAQPPGDGLSLTKSASPRIGLVAGDTVTYTFTVTNTGTTPLSGIGVNEIAFTGSGSAPVADCPAGTLQPGQSTTCTATYQVTAVDQGICTVDNTATVAGTDPQQNVVTSAPARARVVTDCGSDVVGSAELGSLEDLGLEDLLGSAELGSLEDLGLEDLLGSAELGSLGAGSAGPEALGSLGVGALGSVGSLGVGALGSLGGAGALIVGALTTPYRPAAAACPNTPFPNVPFLDQVCPPPPPGPAAP